MKPLILVVLALLTAPPVSLARSLDEILVPGYVEPRRSYNVQGPFSNYGEDSYEYHRRRDDERRIRDLEGRLEELERRERDRDIFDLHR
jgi:hypothetical protein